MKVTVLARFRDKNNLANVYEIGDEVEFTEARAEELAKLGFVSTSTTTGTTTEAPVTPAAPRRARPRKK